MGAEWSWSFGLVGSTMRLRIVSAEAMAWLRDDRRLVTRQEVISLSAQLGREEWVR
jgi:hypothetical protein